MSKIFLTPLLIYTFLIFVEIFTKRFFIKKIFKFLKTKNIYSAIIGAKLLRFFFCSLFVVILSFIAIYFLTKFKLNYNYQIYFFSLLPLLKYIVGFFIEKSIISHELKIKKNKLNKIILLINLPELLITTFLIHWLFISKI